MDTCGGVIGWLDSKTYYTAFLEGWALYAENPLISDDTDVYDGEPMKKYGMLKWQVSECVVIDVTGCASRDRLDCGIAPVKRSALNLSLSCSVD